MLRRKLQTLLFLLIALLMSLAIAAVWSLEGVFDEMDHINHEASAAMDQAEGMNVAVSGVEVQLYALQYGKTHNLDVLIEGVEQLNALAQELDQRYVVHEAAIAPVFTRLLEELAAFQLHVGAGATIEDPALQAMHNLAALQTVAQLRQDIQLVSQHASRHAQQEQRALTRRFRWLVGGMIVAFLLVINVSVLLLLRMAGMILKPVDQLVEASRQLAQEHFEYRVSLEGKDEFDELAQAYNNLAQQLQNNEKRKIEMLQQAALTLNHELNNALAIIQLQLRLLQRKSGDAGRFEDSLRQIEQTMGRMAKVIESFKNVRRIVLTDYISGVKMLDLERSTQQESPAADMPVHPQVE